MEDTLNRSTITQFLLLGFQDLQHYRNTVFFLVFMIYFVSIVGNLFIIFLVFNTRHLLHSPMYFFLSQLSVTDIMISTSVCPTLLPVIWHNNMYVPISVCITQFFMFATSIFAECFLLTVMSYDRYLAICKPLHYGAIMNFSYCLQLAVCAWILGSVVIFIVAFMTSNLCFCGPNAINHFFCDLHPIVELSCCDTTLVQLTIILIGTPETGIESLFIITTYICIFYTILRIPSSTGRQKAFSTCSSHLAVVCTYYGSLIAVYLAPSGGSFSNLNKSMSLLYTLITPLMNPLIYSLKNKEILTTAQKLFQKIQNRGLRHT